ncbi:MAG: NUDIX hydrolase [Proteobacteria bacterium]|nr:NUDIX hydrolase [Pseudomonadota bacterium]MCG6936051.1 NUDIX hydrolase [Pseudomonadota bacterium]
MHVTVAAIIERDGQFLMVEEIVNGKAVFNQPAGHVEADESFLDAVVRESLEETAWNFQPEHATGIYRWQIPGTDQVYLRHCFTGPANGPVSDRPLDDTILRAVWLSQEQLQRQADKLRSPLVLACIEDYLAGQRFPLNLYREIDRN